MLKLRPATVVETFDAAGDPPRTAARRPSSSWWSSSTRPSGRGPRRAPRGDRRRRRSSGSREVGDEVIVNVQALDLGLGSGGFDVVHVNLTRGLDGRRRPVAATRT